MVPGGHGCAVEHSREANGCRNGATVDAPKTVPPAKEAAKKYELRTPALPPETVLKPGALLNE
jgi:hypothetical protein